MMHKHLLPIPLLLLPLLTGAGELADLLHAALAHPQVESARLQREAADTQVAAQDGRLYGQGSLFVGWRRYEAPHVLGYYAPGTGPLPPVDREIGSVGLAYILPVDLTGVISAARERARHDARAAALSEAQQRLAKLHQTLAAWAILQGLNERQAALAAYRKRVEATHQRILHEVRLGKTAQVEAKNAESELARLAAEQAALAGRMQEARAAVVEATGRDVAVLGVEVPLPAWTSVDLDASLPTALAAARADAAAAQALEARRALYPKLDLVADYTEHYGAGTHQDAWSVGMVATLPLGVSPYRQADAQRVKAMAEAANRDAARRETERQLTSLKAAYDSAVADAAALEREIAYREEVVRVQHEMARLGSQTLENLFRHERDLLDARSRRAEARARAAAAWSASQVVIGLAPETYIATLDPK